VVSSERQIATALVGKQRFEKADDERSVGRQRAAHLGEYAHRLLEILHSDAAQRRIKQLVRQRQCGIAVQVLHEPMVEPRIGG